MFELTGQTAIVTGAATGIGEAIAEHLSRAGAAVVIADLNLPDAEVVAKRLGGGALPCMRMSAALIRSKRLCLDCYAGPVGSTS